MDVRKEVRPPRKSLPLLAALGVFLLFGALAASASEDLDALLQRIPGESTIGRAKIIEQVGDLGTPEAVQALIALFPDDELRWMAVHQLILLKYAAIPALIGALDDDNVDIVRFAAYALGEIRTPKAVPALLPLLDRSETEVRQNVVFALGMIRDKAATDALIKTLEDPDPVVRGYAATALGEIGDKRAKEALLTALRKEDASVVNMATSLYNLGGKEVVEILIEKLRDPNPNNRLYAVYALGKISDPAEIHPLIEVLKNEEIGWLAAKALVNIGSMAVLPLLEALFAEDRNERLYATYALGEIRDPKAGRGLLRMLQDPDPLVQETAAGALARIGDRGMIPAVSQLLSSPAPRVRQSALDVLGRLGDPSVVISVASFLADPDPAVAKSAILALGNLQTGETCTTLVRLLDQSRPDFQDAVRTAFLNTGEPAVPCLIGVVEAHGRGHSLTQAIYLLGKLKAAEAVEPLLRLLRDPDPIVRRFVTGALTEIGDPRAEEHFVSLLNDPDATVRTYASVGLMNVGGRLSIRLLLASLGNPDMQWLAVRILDKIGSRDVDSLIAALKDERTQWYAEQSLSRLEGDVMPHLEDRLKGDDTALRQNVARIMGATKDRRAVPPLLEALQSKETGLESATALIQIADPASVEPLIALLDNRSEPVRLYAAYALGGLKDRRAVSPLGKALVDPSSSVRGMAAHALGEIGSREPMDALLRALDDHSGHVRSTAAYALARVGDRRAVSKLEERLREDQDFTVRVAVRDALDALRKSGR